MLPYEQKRQAVAYFASNCGTQSERAQIMNTWIQLNAQGKEGCRCTLTAAVATTWTCLGSSQPWPRTAKQQVFQLYRFCIAMENSIAHDYITEKVWDALAMGCVPRLVGSSTILKVVPDRQSVIFYGPGGNATTVEELDALVHRIGTDKALWERMVAWKARPLNQLSAGYQQYRQQSKTSNECNMCIYIVKMRMNPQMPVRAVTCLWNETWMAGAGKQVASPNITC